MTIMNNLFRNRSIRWKFIVYTVLPIIIVLSIFLLVAIRNLEELSVSRIEQENMHSVDQIGGRLERQFIQLAGIANLNRQFLELSPSLNPEMVKSLVSATLVAHPLVYGSAIAFEPYWMGGDKKLFSPYAYHAGGKSAIIDIGDPDPHTGYDYTNGEWEWYSAPRQSGTSLWTAPYFDQGAGNIIMTTYSVPFYRNGMFVGVTTIDVALATMFTQLGIVEDGNNVIVAKDGKFIHHPDPAYILEKSIYELGTQFSPDQLQQLMTLAASGKPGMQKLQTSGGNGLTWAFYYPIPASEWIYLYLLPEDTALAFTRYQWRIFTGLFALTIILIIGILWFMSGLLTSPIRELHAAALKVSEGDFNVWVRNKSSDELGKLTSIFNRMVASLSRREDDLERKVEERTRDLTASQDKLADQLALQQALIDTIPNPIFYKGADTRFLGFNKAYEETFNVKARDLIGLRVLDLDYLPESDRLAYQAEDEDTILNQRTIRREMQMPFADGKVHTTLYWVSGFRRSDGTPGGLIGTFVDISDQKEIARQLEVAKEAAEAATLAKANFLASMSHEIRTPMNGIIGMVELLRQSNLGSEHQSMLQTIADSGQALLTIINDILDFSKIEAGRMQLEAIPVSLINVVEGSAETLATAASAKGLKLITFINPNIPFHVVADQVRLRQILINLIGNAIKFTDRGEIIIRADRIEPDTGDKLNIRFSVRDRGIGIAEEAQHHLFQAFTQAESSTTRKYGGTGLGLSICQRLVEMMGGRMGVNSRLGEGSEFFALVPVGRSIDKLSDYDYTRVLHGLTVAVASGSDIELLVCRKYLEQRDVRVYTCKIPELCINEAGSVPALANPPDIFVLGSSWDFEQQKKMMEHFRGEQSLASTKFVFLIPGRRREKPRLYGNNLVTIDVGPLKYGPFINAIAIAAGRKSPEVHYDDRLENLKASYTPTVEEAAESGTLILVVEDNPVNQDVIRRQLAMLGFACEVADNGVEALKARRKRSYAVVLTDCHMPEMDGFELTAKIREEDKTTGAHTPIIAITANALQGEAEKCIAAGMDDYMAKPILMKELRNKLDQWMPVANYLSSDPVSDTTAPQVKHPTESAPLDIQVLKDMFGDDETVRDILGEFITPSLAIVAEIKSGFEAKSGKAVAAAAHKLKSSARSVGANALADLCAELEAAGKVEDMMRITLVISGLDPVVAATTKFIDDWLAQKTDAGTVT